MLNIGIINREIVEIGICIEAFFHSVLGVYKKSRIGKYIIQVNLPSLIRYKIQYINYNII